MQNYSQRISAEKFIAQHINHKVTVLDLRTSAEVNNEYIADCACLPVQELTPASFRELLADIGHDNNTPVYLLCQSGLRAEKAVEKLFGEVSVPLVIIDGGLNQLKAAGIKVIKGKGKVISLERQVRIAAGALTLKGAILANVIHPYYIGISAFVGAGLMFAGITNTCGMALMLAKMPWNSVK